MSSRVRRHGTRLGLATLTLALALVCLPALAGCGSSGGPPAPTPVPLGATATPTGGVYSAAQNVTLAATGDGSAGATIYYTMDLSTPTDASTMYTGPIAAGDKTIIKFFARDTNANDTQVYQAAFQVVTPGTKSAQWAASGHGSIGADAWRNWDDAGEVRTPCAKCHSDEGFVDYVEDGTLDLPGALSYGLGCGACHTSIPATKYDDLGTYPALEPVMFPSGALLTLAGPSNICTTCHQGRSSKPDVDAAAPNAEVQTPVDYDSFSFINIHYYAAAASYFGAEAQGGYEYDGLDYVDRNTFPSHPDSLSTCVGCHMREDALDHTWTPDLARCTECHTGAGFTTLSGSPGANYTAIQAALPELYAAIQAYAITLGYPILYDAAVYPYFMNDNGQPSSYGNGYQHFDETLLRAAYNYQFGLKEPCAYVHNGTYMRQLLHDSIDDLGAVPGDVPNGRAGHTPSGNLYIAKTDEHRLSGHAHASGGAFRHWDGDTPPVVASFGGSAICSRCHTSPGFADWAVDGAVATAQPPLSVVGCIACHQNGNLYADDSTRWDALANNALRPVLFPSGDTADLGGPSNVCMGCHQGRASGPDVADAITATPGGPHSFINIHYYPAAAIFFGTDVNPGYHYRSDALYRGENPFASHGTANNTCLKCHMRGVEDHSFEPQLQDCAPCHGDPVVGWKADFGGSPGANYTEIQSLLTDLYAAMQAYALGTIGTGIYYDGDQYPYFFKMGGSDAYDIFDDALLGAAYNFQVGQKEPCGYIHNGIYMRQILYDSLDDLDGGGQDNSVAGHSRP